MKELGVIILEKEYIGVKELAQKLGVHPHTIRRTVMKQIPHYKMMSKILFKIDEVEEWIKDQRCRGAN